MNLSVIELSVLIFCAISLGIAIHFFFVSRRNFKNTPIEAQKLKKKLEQWKLKYFNDLETKERLISDLQKRLVEAEESSSIYQLEAEELKEKSFAAQNKTAPDIPVTANRPDYVAQLKQAQEGLSTHHQKIEQLLGVIDVMAETEEKQKAFEEERQELMEHVSELKYQLKQKESELSNLKQQEIVSKEMTSMLDNAYSEFSALQNKIQTLESQLSANKLLNLEYEDLREGYYKVSRDYEEQKLKLQAITLEHQQLTLQFNEAEDKLREANFQRQQLQKRVTYLEELNNDLQLVAAANKKLEHQLRRIGELESMLNVIAEERDELLKKKEVE